MTVGKAIAAGIPAAAYGFSREVAEQLEALLPRDERADVGGIGGTVAANVLSLAAMRATLGEVLTDDAFARMITLGERFEAGVAGAIERHGLPWHVTRLGCRVEYLFRAERPKNGSEAAAGGNAELDRLIHLYALNRGILLTPFHNMALMSPATTEADVDLHSAVFDEAARELSERLRMTGRCQTPAVRVAPREARSRSGAVSLRNRTCSQNPRLGVRHCHEM